MTGLELGTKYLDMLKPLDRYKDTFNFENRLGQIDKQVMESFLRKTSAFALSHQIQNPFASIAMAHREPILTVFRAY